MKSWSRFLFSVLMISLFAGAIPAGRPTNMTSNPVSRQPAVGDQGTLGQGISVPFVQNVGQLGGDVLYYANTLGAGVIISREGVEYLGGPDAPVISESFVGGAAIDPQGLGRSATGVGYFIGSNSSEWHPEVPAFDSLSLGQPWPGVEVRLNASGGGVESAFYVSPGADTGSIRIRVSGVKGIESDGQGLTLVSGQESVLLLGPSAYQVVSGKRVLVPIAYSHDSSTFGFVVGDYDHSSQLVIDPLLQTTYLGGGISFHPQGMVVDQSGDVYVTGQNNLGTWGAPTLYFVNKTVAYVAKINSNLTKFIQISYVGGNCSDSGNALALDSAGDVYLVGTTCSQDLPGVGGGVQQNASIFYGGFVMKLNSALTSIIQSTYLSGNSGGDATAIAIDSAGDVYVAGSSGSTVFPGMAGGFQTSPKSSSNTFVSKLNGNLRSVIQSTYYGGSDVDYATSLGLDQSGNVFLAGTTRSDDLPGTAGGAQPTFVPVDSSDFADGFVAKFNAGLTSLIQATYIGNVSSWGDFGSMAVARSGNVYFAAPTASPYIPNTARGAEPNFTGSFVTELDNGLKSVIQTTYLPLGQGANVDALGSPVANAIALDSAGNVYVAGGAGNNGFGYSIVVLVSKLSGDLRTAMGTAYLMGSNLQQGGGTTAQSITIGPTGDVYLAGGTSYPDMMGIQGGAVTENPGGAAFVSMLTPDLGLETSVSASCSPASIPVNSTTTCTAKATGQTPRTAVSPYVSWVSNGTGVFSTNACDVSAGSCSVNFTAYSSGHLAITARYDGDFNTPATSITSVVLVVAAATNTTTSTTTSSTSTSTAPASTSATSTTSTTSSTSSTTAATTSLFSSTSQTTSSTVQTTSTTTTTGSGGIPEFPYQEVVATAFTVLIVVSYLLVGRGRWPRRPDVQTR